MSMLELPRADFRMLSLFLQDGIVAVADQPGPHGFSIFDIGKGSNLDTKQFFA